MGQLVPMHVQEVIPGDKFHINSKNMVRLAPMVSPAMHRVKVYTSYFFVPNRILWPNWEKFITGGETGMDNPAPPIFPDITFLPGSLPDYMGLPVSPAGTPDPIKFGTVYGNPVSLLPMAAYALIYYEYYRDQNLQTLMPKPELTDGVNTLNSWMTTVQFRAWRHDYLTSALPFAQKGAAVSIPVAGSITGEGSVYLNTNSANPMGFTDAAAGGGLPSEDVISDGAAWLAGGTTGTRGVIEPNDRLSVDGTDFDLGAISTTINDLRTAYSLQKWLEKNARAGSRYIESLRAHFFTSPTDARLQRPEMIGSNVQNVVISEVLQTSSSDAVTPQGNMAGHGISASKDGHFSYTAQEHGFIIGLISVMPDTAYCDGMPKHFSRQNRLDYYWPDFANLGEQAILGREVCCSARSTTPQVFADNTATFGYIPRYAEYRFQNSLATGGMRPGADYGHWTLTRKFDPTAPPPLNDDFIRCQPSKRIFAVTSPDDNEIICHVFNDVKARRSMPKYANPGW
jgi:hypothetical protein